MSEISSICVPQGFVANGVYCGIKGSKKLDLSLIYSKVPAKVGCSFTSNAIKAAHIYVDQKHLRKTNSIQAIIINSGNANCANGPAGIKDAEYICSSLAKIIGLKTSKILIASTGIIGKRMPVDKVKRALLPLVMGLNRYNARNAALGIMTTDTQLKQVAVSFKLVKNIVNIGGIAKGAGMIHPHMATMLSFITTDVNISLKLLKRALKKAVDNSFNLISVDGCMSTNDTVIILANGLSGNKIVNSETSPEFKLFYKNLETVCLRLAKMIVKDAEGATKFIAIKVTGAKDYLQAKTIAFSIADSILFKTAAYGCNPNWGRIIAAAGASDFSLKEENITIEFNEIKVFRKGKPLDFKRNLLKNTKVMVSVDLGIGRHCATIYTADLSTEYVKINAEYN